MSGDKRIRDPEELEIINDDIFQGNDKYRKNVQKYSFILIGHSFGARVITRAIFSNGLIDPPKVNKESSETHQKNTCDVDLVIGLQGAFSINRFIPGEGEEGSPYRTFSTNTCVKNSIVNASDCLLFSIKCYQGFKVEGAQFFSWYSLCVLASNRVSYVELTHF